MIKYRIVEKEFGDGRIEFFPEAYSGTYKKISKIETDGWISVADVELRVTDEGYETIEEAQLKIDEHKRLIKKLLKEETVVKTTVHEIN